MTAKTYLFIEPKDKQTCIFKDQQMQIYSLPLVFLTENLGFFYIYNKIGFLEKKTTIRF